MKIFFNVGSKRQESVENLDLGVHSLFGQFSVEYLEYKGKDSGQERLKFRIQIFTTRL